MTPSFSVAATQAQRILGAARSAKFPLAAPSWPTTVERPDPERKVGLDYDHEWSRRYPVRLARAMVMDNITRPAARLLAPATIRGLEHLEHVERPVIFAANHAEPHRYAAPLDDPSVRVPPPHRCRRGIRLLLRSHLEVHSVVILVGRHPHRAQQGQPPLGRHRGRLLEDGWNLVIFPEGGRSPGRLDATVPRRGGLPGPTHRPTRRAGLPARHASCLAQETRRGCPRPWRIGHRITQGRPPPALSDRRPLRRAMTPDEGENAHRFSERVEASVATLAREVRSDWWQARRSSAPPIRPRGPRPPTGARKGRPGVAPGPSMRPPLGTGQPDGRNSAASKYVLQGIRARPSAEPPGGADNPTSANGRGVWWGGTPGTFGIIKVCKRGCNLVVGGYVKQAATVRRTHRVMNSTVPSVLRYCPCV